jgi:hypothetical protein
VSEFEDFDVLIERDPLEEADGDEAPEGTERKLGVFPNPPLSECPVVPLGFDGSRVVFAMPEGELRFELASKIGTMLRTDIFACEAGQSFLAYWRDGEDKFQRELATVWFVRSCRKVGKWDVRRAQRGLGVWPGEAGAVMLHRGCEVWELKDSKVAKLTVAEILRARASGPIYRLYPPAPQPEVKKPATAADGLWVQTMLDRWSFEPLGDEGLTGADLVMGYVGSSLLGAVSPFRAHLLVYALAGSGKTTLMEFVHALLSAVAGDLINNFTEAGLRGDLAGHARPVVIDEAEASGGPQGSGAIEPALQLLTMMATGAGAVRKQGDASGGGGAGVTQTAVGAVILGGINPPPLPPALATRMAEIRLLPLGSRLATRAELEAAEAKAKALSPGLLGRALRLAGRFRDDHAAIGAAMLRAGHPPRTADLVATLAAGRRLVRFDQALDEAGADAEVRMWSALLDKRAETEAVSNPGADALAHLMSWDSGQHRLDRRQTIGDLVRRWSEREDRSETEITLKNFGLQLYEDELGPWLIVANHHPTLDRIFEKTKWAAYRRTLEHLDALLPEGAKTRVSKPLRYGVGIKQRGLCVPLTPLSAWKPGQGGTVGTQGVPGGVPGQADE